MKLFSRIEAKINSKKSDFLSEKFRRQIFPRFPIKFLSFLSSFFSRSLLSFFRYEIKIKKIDVEAVFILVQKYMDRNNFPSGN